MSWPTFKPVDVASVSVLVPLVLVTVTVWLPTGAKSSVAAPEPVAFEDRVTVLPETLRTVVLAASVPVEPAPVVTPMPGKTTVPAGTVTGEVPLVSAWPVRTCVVDRTNATLEAVVVEVMLRIGDTPKFAPAEPDFTKLNAPPMVSITGPWRLVVPLLPKKYSEEFAAVPPVYRPPWKNIDDPPLLVRTPPV